MSPSRLAAKSVPYARRAVLTLQPASPICSELHLNEEERQTCPGSSLLSRVPCLPVPDIHLSGPRPHMAVSSLTSPVTRWVSLLYTCLECLPPPRPAKSNPPRWAQVTCSRLCSQRSKPPWPLPSCPAQALPASTVPLGI